MDFKAFYTKLAEHTPRKVADSNEVTLAEGAQRSLHQILFPVDAQKAVLFNPEELMRINIPPSEGDRPDFENRKKQYTDHILSNFRFVTFLQVLHIRSARFASSTIRPKEFMIHVPILIKQAALIKSEIVDDYI